MHWFDRMSKQFAAVPTATTRRGVLRGAAIAAVVAPLAPGALAHANRRLRAANANEDCVNCLTRAAAKSQEAVAKCKGEAAKASALLQPKAGAGAGAGAKGKGKGKKGIKAAEAAKRAACMSKAAKSFLKETTTCAKFSCAGFGENAPPIAHPLPTTGGESTCPSGTILCSGTLCCYGGDNCCPCASVDGGNICCAAVIQCTCC